MSSEQVHNQDTLADAFQAEQSRCRELLEAYIEIGPAGWFGRVILKDLLNRADAAVMNGDVVLMLQIYGEMKECR